MAPATNTAITMEPQYLQQLQAEFDRIKPQTDYRCDGGQAIIYVGGGKYWPGIYVGIHLLRKLGCTLPVEVWHRASETIYPEDVAGMGVTFNLINREIGGWEAKLHALYNTRYSQVLYLDADAYCIANPLPLFNLLSEENPFIYWQDLPSQANSIKWKLVYPDGAKLGIPPCQGGQILIDREYAWRTIHTSKYMCDNSAYYFRRMYGDQDTWRVCLAGDTSKYLVLGKAQWDKVAFRCAFDGTDYILHRCKGKLYAPADCTHHLHSNPHYSLPHETEVFGLLAECINRRAMSAESTFDNVYRKRLWGNHATLSGAGSSVREAMPLLDLVQELIESNGYTKVVDAGCGDGHVGALLKVKEYVGYDCSEHILKLNQKKFPKRTYKKLDICSSAAIMECGDVLLCKDVLHHWSNDWVRKFLDAVVKADKWKAVVLCFDIQQRHDGQDCYLGGYRALSVDMEPLKSYGFKYAKTYFHKGIVVISNPLNDFKCLSI